MGLWEIVLCLPEAARTTIVELIISPRPCRRHATTPSGRNAERSGAVAAKAGTSGALPVMARLTMEPTMMLSIVGRRGLPYEVLLALANGTTAV
jgi:hypothetical protein